MKHLRTIETILNLITGEQIEVNELFKDSRNNESEIFQLRAKIEEQIQTEKIEYVCLYCKQPVALRGRRNSHDLSKHFYFTHPYKSVDCIIKTKSKLTEEQVRCIKYNGVKESQLHETLKNLIGYYLNQDDNILSVRVDKVYKDVAVSRGWRKPDVLAIFKEMKIAFEIQLSTTFISVIVGRTIFYRERGIFLIWIFPGFSVDIDVQKFTQKDVYYNNNFNVYVFDKEAQEKSNEANQLILTCLYKEFYMSQDDSLAYKWSRERIKISDLNFDFQKQNVCYYDSDLIRKQTLIKIQEKKDFFIKQVEQEQIKTDVDIVLNYLRKFYKNDFVLRSREFPLDLIQNQNSIDALNNALKFKSEKKGFITKLFFERNKPNFLKLICEQDNIHIDTSSLILNGKTAFQEIIYLDSMNQFRHFTSCLFRKGYELTKEDEIYYENLYDKNYFNYTEHEKEYIERWAITTILKNLKSKNYAFVLLKEIDKVLYSILSLKHDLIIEFKFNSLLQVSHYLLTNHPEFGDIYLKAMKVYKRYETQIEEDKSGKLRLKIDNFISNKPQQEERYNTMIFEIFPELE